MPPLVEVTTQPPKALSTVKKVAKKNKKTTNQKKRNTNETSKMIASPVPAVQHELDEELYDECVDNIELNLEEDENFIPASGMSEEAAHSYTGQCNSSIQSPTSYICEQCGSVLKTKHGFQKHLMSHRIKESNARRPSAEMLQPLIESFVNRSLTEILSEYCEEKKNFVKDILETNDNSESENSDNWNDFILAISEPLLSSISKPTKMLPANQYEEQLISLNRFLNDDKFLALLNDFMSLSIASHPKSVGKVVLFRLYSKLVDKVCNFVFSEMKKPIAKQSQVNMISDVEAVAFEFHMQSIIRKYYIKGLAQGSKLWLARCACIRQRFVESCECDSGPSVDDFISSDAWEENEDGILKLKLNTMTLNFFVSVESIIECLIVQNENVNSENVLTILLNKSEKAELLEIWYSLTSPFLSEVESLVFMRDILSVVCSLSLRLEVGRVRSMDTQKRIQKYALRTDLKRN